MLHYLIISGTNLGDFHLTIERRYLNNRLLNKNVLVFYSKLCAPVERGAVQKIWQQSERVGNMMLHNKERIHSCKEKKTSCTCKQWKSHIMEKEKRLVTHFAQITCNYCIILLGKIISFDNLTNQLGNLLRCCNHKEEVNVCSATNMWSCHATKLIRRWDLKFMRYLMDF